jgi:hypothetical protein
MWSGGPRRLRRTRKRGARGVRRVCGSRKFPVEVTLAEWHWYVTVETLEECGNNSWSPVDSEQLHFLTTEVDPPEVEYRDTE